MKGAATSKNAGPQEVSDVSDADHPAPALAAAADLPPEVEDPRWPQDALVTRLRSARWPRHLARRAVRVRARGAAAARMARCRWRSSLQLRVVTATLVISAIVVTVLGFFLIQQVADGLLRAKVKSASDQAEQGRNLAVIQPGVDSLKLSSTTTPGLMYSIVNDLQAKSSTANDFSVAVLLSKGKGPPVYYLGASADFPTGDIPDQLKQDVERDRLAHPSAMSYQSRSLPFPGSTDKPVPGLIFGAPFGSYYQLYYFFPLTQERQTLAIVQRTLLLVGLALVFLLAGIAWLVTRWVVVPVAHAAQSAQRLSAGSLDERMPVRGSDELTALATSFNEMAASLQEKVRELEDLSQVQRQFVSDVSHELRTPLTTIKIAADMLFEFRGQLDASVSRSAELLQSQLERFESLLVDLLEISRYDANAATLDAEPVNVCDLVRHSADVAQQLAERRGAKIEFRLPAEPCVADVDRRRVERILRNLLVNAVEHGENRDAVVTVAGDRDAVAVAVRDYGVGLSAGEVHLVFDRFWRADPARARTTGGTGLGLSIALEDARLHGGWLEAWGEPGRGSVFRLTLPRLAGGELAGSPLPLAPDEAELAGVLAERAGAAARAAPYAPAAAADIVGKSGTGHG